MRSSIGLALAVAVGIGAAVASCGPKNNAGHGGSNGNGDGGTVGGGNGDGGGGNGACVGLQCQQMSCPGGGTTTLTGKVYAPNGTLPLYNAIVYIPNATPMPFPEGVTCDRCSGSVSGDPVVQTLTDATGSFTLTNVPVGANIPLVIQLGKWRRQVTIPSVPGCTSTPLDAGMTRLPKDHTEGDIPKMAIVTGSADPLECLLLKIGISPTEIQEPAANTRIAFFKGDHSPGTTMSGNTPKGTTLYGNMATLMQYDVVMLPCEGSQYDQSAGRDNISSYLNAGGRVFTTHYSYDWLTYASSPFNKITKTPAGSGLWKVGQPDYYDDTIVAPLVTSFPKGMAFAQWLTAAGAMSPMGMLNIVQGRHDITDVDPKYAQDWIDYDFSTPPTGVTNKNGGPGVMHLTFNTPLDAQPDDMGVPQYCGRAVFSDFHVTADALDGKGTTFPTNCKSQDPLTDQEKALAFMLFDLSSCVQSDQMPPIP
jgi:hypothetical protein